MSDQNKMWFICLFVQWQKVIKIVISSRVGLYKLYWCSAKLNCAERKKNYVSVSELVLCIKQYEMLFLDQIKTICTFRESLGMDLVK